MYLSLGMTEEQFWKGEPYLTAAYRKADELKRKRQNEALWLQGMYVYDALSVVMSNAFKEKGAKKAEYPAKPYRFLPMTAEEKAEEEKKEQQRARDYFESLRKSWAKTNGEQKQ